MIALDDDYELKERLRCKQILDSHFYKWMKYFQDDMRAQSPYARAVRYEERIYLAADDWEEYHAQIRQLTIDIEKNALTNREREEAEKRRIRAQSEAERKRERRRKREEKRQRERRRILKKLAKLDKPISSSSSEEEYED